MGMVCQRRISSFLRTSLLFLCLATYYFNSASIQADTIYLKNGQFIPDCKILKEDQLGVHIRTPSGNMTVPRSEINKIQKILTVHDIFDQRLRELKDNDFKGQLKLLEWSRKQNDLRKEGDALLSKILKKDPSNDKAHQLAGHVRVGKKWYLPPPLKLQLNTLGVHKDNLQKKLKMFLSQRKDVILQEASRKDKENESAKVKTAKKSLKKTVDLNQAELRLSVTVSASRGTKFFNQSLGNGSKVAVVNLSTQSKWLGRSPTKTRIAGQITQGSTVAIGIQNAFGQNGANLNNYLDQLLKKRVSLLQKAYKKNPPKEQVFKTK